jgi:hypothetical protein
MLALIAKEIQRVALTGTAALVDVPFVLGMVRTGAVSWTSAETPPPPPVVRFPRGEFGLKIITLPTELVANAVAASVAAVERSPATAANEAWNCPSWKLATACWISWPACWSMVAQTIAAWASPAAIAV